MAKPDFTKPGSRDFIVNRLKFHVDVGRDEFGLFWGQVTGGKSILYNTSHYDDVENAWSDALGWLRSVGRVEL